jgi:Family of unknown function (DUF5764)
MDDFVIANLHESRNEWCSRLVSIFTPLVMEGIRSIFDEAWKICLETDEPGKYLMTFQNLLLRIPKWNAIIVEEERKRIIERSGCNYLEDLITCVHIIQLKVLTCVRVGNKQKKIDISIPKLDAFIHKIYIHVARKVYTNVYLFEKNISPLQVQKHNREFEVLVQESIMMTIRESIPTEEIIRAYMEESVEHEEEVTIEPITDDLSPIPEQEKTVTNNAEVVNDTPDPTKTPTSGIQIQNLTEDEEPVTTLKFNSIDTVLDSTDNVHNVEAPKTIEHLENISAARAMQRKLDEAEEEEEDRITIGDSIDLGQVDVLDADQKVAELGDNIPLLDVETLV